MMSIEIGQVVERVTKWDPKRDGIGSFTYVDLSSVDQNRKEVTEPSLLEASEAPSRARQLIEAGDVLVSTVRPNLNAVAYVPECLEGATASTGFCVLRPRSGSVDGRYLFHWVRSRRFIDDMVRLATGASYPAVSDKIVKSSAVPLPPIEEQRRIAAVLDEADALRTKRRQALAKLDTLTQAIFIDMFGDPVKNPQGWPVVTIGEVIDSATYGTSKKAHSVGTYPVLRMGNLTSGGDIDLAALKYVDLEGKELDKHLAVRGDVLFNRTNSPDLVGKTAVWRGSNSVAYAGYLIRLRPGDRLHPEYLGAFMNLSTTKQTLRAMCKSIIGMANINAKEVQSIEIPLPPSEGQEAFASVREAVEAKRRTHERQLRELDALFASLQQRAFGGEL